MVNDMDEDANRRLERLRFTHERVLTMIRATMAAIAQLWSRSG